VPGAIFCSVEVKGPRWQWAKAGMGYRERVKTNYYPKSPPMGVDAMCSWILLII
jgi:hypothetical protein